MAVISRTICSNRIQNSDEILREYNISKEMDVRSYNLSKYETKSGDTMISKKVVFNKRKEDVLS